MPRHATAITGAAGEHFVAARLAAMGFVVALTRGGSPTADILVSTRLSDRTIAIQVKTATWARREYKTAKSKPNNHWEWQMGWDCDASAAPNLWYASVDLRGWPDGPVPEVFLVPSSRVASMVAHAKANGWTRCLMWLPDAEAATYRETWQEVAAALGRKSLAVGAERERRSWPPPTPTEGAPPRSADAKAWMAWMLRTKEGQTRMRKRKSTVELVFGCIKGAMGFRQFLLRGIDKVRGEWALVCIAYNIRKLHLPNAA
jgi:hypothetical protein